MKTIIIAFPASGTSSMISTLADFGFPFDGDWIKDNRRVVETRTTETIDKIRFTWPVDIVKHLMELPSLILIGWADNLNDILSLAWDYKYFITVTDADRNTNIESKPAHYYGRDEGVRRQWTEDKAHAFAQDHNLVYLPADELVADLKDRAAMKFAKAQEDAISPTDSSLQDKSLPEGKFYHFHLPPDGKEVLRLDQSGKSMEEFEQAYARLLADPNKDPKLKANWWHADWLADWGPAPRPLMETPPEEEAHESKPDESEQESKPEEPPQAPPIEEDLPKEPEPEAPKPTDELTHKEEESLKKANEISSEEQSPEEPPKTGPKIVTTEVEEW